MTQDIRQFTVQGRVQLSDGSPLVGVKVVALDQDLRMAQMVGESCITDANGHYVIHYNSGHFLRAEKGSADLFVRVLNPAGGAYLETPVVFNAPADATIDAKVSAALPGIPSEYERLIAELEPLLVNVTIESVRNPAVIEQLADLKPADIDFLADETGETRPKVQSLVGAALAAQQAAVLGFDAPAVAWYGLARIGFSLDPQSLAARSDTEVSAALTQAMAGNLIATVSDEELRARVSAIRQVAANQALSAPPTDGGYSLGVTLHVAGLSASQQVTLLTLSANHVGTTEAFWDALRKQPDFQSPGSVERVQLTLQLGLLTQNHIPLIQALQQANVTSTRDLVTWDESRWLSMINAPTGGAPVGVPSEIAGATAAEQALNYASGIVATVQAAFPTETLAHIVSKTASVPSATAVTQFFENSQEFDVRSSNVSRYVRDNADAAFKGISDADRPVVVEQVNRLQRVFQLSPDANTTAALLNTGLSSAHAIAKMSQKSFLSQYSLKLGGEGPATAVYGRARAINARVLHILVTVQDQVSGVQVAAISGSAAPTLPGLPSAPTSEANRAIVAPTNSVIGNSGLAPSTGAPSAAAPSAAAAAVGNAPQAQTNLLKVLPDYAELFGSLDLCQCSDCRSVLSPAAYLVDLFEFLRHSTPNDASKTPLDALFARRPDLPLLPLTCENTNVALPYLDLVNEVLESYVVFGPQIVVHDTGAATTAELNASPQHTNEAAYVTLNQALFPPTLPFNQPVVAARAYLENLGTSRYEVVNTFQTQQNAATAAGIAAEYLKITREEFQILAGEDFGGGSITPHSVWEFYGYATPSTGALSKVPELINRLRIEYQDLTTLVLTAFMNPNFPQGPVLDTFNKIPMSFGMLTKLVVGKFDTTDAGLTSAVTQAFGSWNNLTNEVTKALDSSWQAFIDWSNANYKALSQLLVLDAPNNTCDLSTTVLVHLDGSDVTDAEFGKLHRLVRLWRKLGWSIVEVDRSIAALGTNDVTADVLLQLASVQRLRSSVNVDLQVFLSIWAPTLNTRGDDALYTKLFLNKAAPGTDPAFAPNPDGSLLTGSEVISAHVPALLSALRMSAIELSAVLADASLLDTSLLSLANVTTLHRYTALASVLRLSIRDLLAIKALTTINPFNGPEATVQFQGIVTSVAGSGLSGVQLNYLYRHLTTPTADLSPRVTQLRSLASTLHSGLVQIVRDNANNTDNGTLPDPTGEASRAKLSLLFDATTTEQAIAMINGTAIYVAPLVALPPGFVFPTSVSAKTSFDSANQVLRFRGPMSDVEQKDFNAAPLANSALIQAVNELRQQPLTFIQNTFSGFLDPSDASKNLVQDVPTLDASLSPTELDSTGAVTTDPSLAVTTVQATKFSYLLARLLPYVTTQLSHAFVKQSLAGTLALDTEVTQVLLETVLTSQIDAKQPAIGDFVALLDSGLTPTYFTNATLTDPPATEAAPSLVGGPPIIPAGTLSARWTGLLTLPSTGSFTFSLVTNAGQAQLWLEDVLAPVTQDPQTKIWSTAPIPLKASQLVPLRVELANLPASGATAQLLWQSATVPNAAVPATALLPAARIDVFTAAFTRLQKVALLVGKFALSAAEISYLALHAGDFAGFDFNALPLTRTTVNASALDQNAPALFTAWKRINDYVTLRNSLPAGTFTLLDVFRATTPQDAGAALVQATGWDADSVATLAGPAGFNLLQAAFKNEIALTALQTCFALLQRLGVSAAQLFSWGDLNSPFTVLQQTVVPDIKKAVRGKYDPDTWLTVSKSINDGLRQSQRDALIAYLLTIMGLTDADQLYEYFLIDPQMCACMETSRIKQAISSVQLFVQRILLNLEHSTDPPATYSISPSAIDAHVWSTWKGLIGPWQANRRIFLYPEDWIESSLRDDKSPFFKDLESALLQNEITNDNVQAAFLKYLEAVDEIKNLEICGTYWDDADANTSGPDATASSTLHVFGRTRQQPPTYFYRRRLNNSVWTAWEPVNAGVEGDHLIPVVWSGRLILYWAIFTQKADPPAIPATTGLGQAIDQSRQYYEVGLAWSEYKQGKWSPKQLGRSDVVFDLDFESADGCFFTSETVSDSFKQPNTLLLHIEMGENAQQKELDRLRLGTFSIDRDGRPVACVPEPKGVQPQVLQVADVASDAMSLKSLASPEGLSVWQDSTTLLNVLSQSDQHFWVLPGHQPPLDVIQRPFFYQDERPRVFFVEPQWSTQYIPQLVKSAKVVVKQYQKQAKKLTRIVERFAFDAHYHPFVTDFIKALAQGGIAGLLSESSQTLGTPNRHSRWTLAAWGSTTSVSATATGSASIVQITEPATPGTLADFHALILEGNKIVHYRKDNNAAQSPWQMVDVVSSAATGAASIVQSGHVPLDAVLHAVVLEGGNLVHYFNGVSTQASAWPPRFKISSKATGLACLTLGRILLGVPPVQTLELVALEGTTLVHYTYDGTTWNAGFPITNSTISVRSSASVILKRLVDGLDFGLELVVCEGGAAPPYDLVHYSYDGSTWTRREVITSNATDAGCIIQSNIRNGSVGNFEVVVPEGPALVHYWRDNSTPGATWQQGQIITNRAAGPAAIIQSTFGKSPDGFRGNFEVLALETSPTVASSRRIVHYWNSSDGLFQFAETYQPVTANVADPYPMEDVDFRYAGSHSIYNWETFFYAPLLIATSLSTNKRFQEAMNWFHYIFFPMDDTASERAPERYWKFVPFKDVPQVRVVDMLMKLDAGDPDLESQIQDWAQYPFAPFRIARLRPSAFQKSVFMKYLDNLVAWGDSLFMQDTIESINQAAQLYVLCAHLLGNRPETVPSRTKDVTETYAQLSATSLDEFSDQVVTLENAFLFTTGITTNAMGDAGGLLGVSSSLYFCVPQNDKLLGYWDTVADRLFKIRNCMNIQGVVQQLPLFEPPIDPALLVQAAAQGADLSSILNDINAPVPYYRFSYTLQKALEMCAEVRSLGAALLAALEKRDAEALAALRATQETNILALTRQMKQFAYDEAENQWLALTRSQNTAVTRYAYYQQMLTGVSPAAVGDGVDLPFLPIPPTQGTELSIDSSSRLFAEEQSELELSQNARNLQVAIQDLQTQIMTFSWIPTATLSASPWGVGLSSSYGGSNLVQNASALAAFHQAEASQDSYDASHAGKMAGYFRRQLDWTLQSNLAAGEYNQLNKQLLAAKIRFQMADYELNTLYPKQLENAQAMQDALTSKYTNQELYTWMVGQIGTTYSQCYNLAYGLAKKAERAFRYERGVVNSNYIQFGYWDSFRKGLQSGEQLYLALKQMEGAYQDQNKREYEIAKRVSLLLLDPMALISLKETGQCAVDLPEALFDVDYPGHYMRRLKTVSLTIPCVTGPYTSVNCTLTLLKSKIRLQSAVGAGYAEQDSDPRFAYNFTAADSIATSTAENDSGMFEVSFHDERYLPFEGNGAVSQWRLEMPPDNNAFDFETITDVVINLLYTSRPGGAPLAQAVKKSLGANTIPDGVRLFSTKHEFPTEWYQFLNPADPSAAQAMTLNLSQDRFPFLLRGKTLTFDTVDVFLVFKTVYDKTVFKKTKNPTPLGDYAAVTMNVTPAGASGSTTATLPSAPSVLAGLPHGSADLTNIGSGTVGPWQFAMDPLSVKPLPDTLTVQTSGGVSRLKPEVVDDVWILAHYTVT